jgi:hypothetical protein
VAHAANSAHFVLHRVANHWNRLHPSFYLGSDRRGCRGSEDIPHVAATSIHNLRVLVGRTRDGRQGSPRFPIHALYFTHLPNEGVLRSVVANIGYHTAEWGEMTANAPAPKLPGALSLPLQILGAFVIIACVVGLWVKRDRPDSLLC